LNELAKQTLLASSSADESVLSASKGELGADEESCKATASSRAGLSSPCIASEQRVKELEPWIIETFVGEVTNRGSQEQAKCLEAPT
jgi:hypothetical protein